MPNPYVPIRNFSRRGTQVKEAAELAAAVQRVAVKGMGRAALQALGADVVASLTAQQIGEFTVEQMR